MFDEKNVDDINNNCELDYGLLNFRAQVSEWCADVNQIVCLGTLDSLFRKWQKCEISAAHKERKLRMAVMHWQINNNKEDL